MGSSRTRERRELDPESIRGGTRPIPALMATTNQADTLWPQLLARGWVPFGNSLQAATGELCIGMDRLQLMLDGDVVLDDDANPASPEGWWTAVDNLNGHCVVVIIRGDTLDLRTPEAGGQLAALLHTDHALSAALPIVTKLTT